MFSPDSFNLKTAFRETDIENTLIRRHGEGSHCPHYLATPKCLVLPFILRGHRCWAWFGTLPVARGNAGGCARNVIIAFASLVHSSGFSLPLRRLQNIVKAWGSRKRIANIPGKWFENVGTIKRAEKIHPNVWIYRLYEHKRPASAVEVVRKTWLLQATWLRKGNTSKTNFKFDHLCLSRHNT